MDYSNKNVLAPMVRIGTLPTRLLSLDYGADIVYSEEIIDFKLLQCTRKENGVLGTVDYVLSDDTIVFRTCEKEKGKVVFQMGTADAKRAVKVAKMIENDVAAIDINMGCPKEFSIKGGMGAALLQKPDTAKEIMSSLVQAVQIPVTCKIRILDTLEETIEFARMMESTGISAIGVHGRQRDERPRHGNKSQWIKQVVTALSIPVIANGGSNEIKTYEDIALFKEASGCSSVMIARAAEWNPSIFNKQGLEPIDQVVKKLLKYAVEYDNNTMNVKFCVQQLYHEQLESKVGQAILGSGTLRELCSIFEMTDFFDKIATKQQEMALRLKRELEGADCLGVKRRRLDDGTELYEMELKFYRNHYDIEHGPKQLLYNHSHKMKYPTPKYESIRNERDRKFYCVVTFGDKKYASSVADLSKKWGEQSAAVVALRVLGLDDGRKQSVMEDPTVNTDLHKKSSAITVNNHANGENESARENTCDANRKKICSGGNNVSGGQNNDICSGTKDIRGLVKTQQKTADDMTLNTECGKNDTKLLKNVSIGDNPNLKSDKTSLICNSTENREHRAS